MYEILGTSVGNKTDFRYPTSSHVAQYSMEEQGNRLVWLDGEKKLHRASTTQTF
jgi:hypothetical protein